MTTSGPGPWLKYGPTSEQEVVVLFALLLSRLPTRYELDEVRQQFPDCLASRVEPDGTRSPIRIEFELYASNFRLHGHDPNGCDLIICWEDDVPGFVVPRLELRPFAEAASPPIIALPVKFKYETTIWTEPTFLASCEPEERTLHEQLLAWAKRHGEVVFGKGAKHPSWTFQLALPSSPRCTLFGVYANGKVWPIWQKLPTDLAERYTQGLRLAPRFKAAIDSGKAWCDAGLKDEAVLPALQAAVEAVVPRVAREPTGESAGT
jgi:hypothetical protein